MVPRAAKTGALSHVTSVTADHDAQRRVDRADISAANRCIDRAHTPWGQLNGQFGHRRRSDGTHDDQERTVSQPVARPASQPVARYVAKPNHPNDRARLLAHRTATGMTGEPVPSATFSGATTNRNSYLPSCAQACESTSRSRLFNKGIPGPAMAKM